jgi:hypothetical protein
MSRTQYRLRLPDESAKLDVMRNNQGGIVMKYILLMSGTKAGVSGYHTWSQNDRATHMQTLSDLIKDLTETGEFVATEGLGAPAEAKVVHGERNGLPVTDGIFPESKEFLLGYWIVDVAVPERAYAIAGRISAAPGPGGIPTNVPIEVRPIVAHAPAAN